MKKALLAAALMTAGVAAQAQSSVTLYGRLDAGLEYLNGGQAGHTIRAESGDWGTSLWGIKGVEDLGGGYKVLFHLEGAFNTMNGSMGTSGTIWDRFATVGISNDAYGTLLLGRELAIANGVWDFDPFGQSNWSTASLVRGRNWNKTSNNISYQSPNLYGFDAYGQYALSNATNFNGNGTTNQGRSAGLQLTYTNSLFQLRGIYDEARDPANGKLDDVFNYSREYFAGANVFLGQFKLQAAYQTSHADGGPAANNGITTTQQVWGRRDVASHAGGSADRGGLPRERQQRRRQCHDLHDRRFVQPVQAHPARPAGRHAAQQQDGQLRPERQPGGHGGLDRQPEGWRFADRHLRRYPAPVLIVARRIRHYKTSSFTLLREARIGAVPEGVSHRFLFGARAT